MKEMYLLFLFFILIFQAGLDLWLPLKLMLNTRIIVLKLFVK